LSKECPRNVQSSEENSQEDNSIIFGFPNTGTEAPAKVGLILLRTLQFLIIKCLTGKETLWSSREKKFR